jgi:hypothetical protein
VQEAISRLESAVVAARAETVQRKGEELVFRAGPFRLVSNWNVLVPISTGFLTVSQQAGPVVVSYRVTFTEMVLVTTVMALFFGGFVILEGRSLLSSLGLLVLAWTWLFGANFVLTAWRFPRFLLASLARASR